MKELDKVYQKAVKLTERVKILLQRKINDCESRLYEYRKQLKENERERKEIDFIYRNQKCTKTIKRNLKNF